MTITDWFGYSAADTSVEATSAASNQRCPFIDDSCEKVFQDGLVAGVCALKQTTRAPVVCCPNRLYGDDWKILRDIAAIAFGDKWEFGFTDGWVLTPGRTALSEAIRRGSPVIGVFGKKWGGELRLPQRGGSGSYFVDWILAVVTPTGLAEFVAVEVQTIDTTGNYRASIDGLQNGREIKKSDAAFNWENVNKRILPQVIYKGNLLQREKLCKGGLFFVTPKPVFERIAKRLLGEGNELPEYPLAPGAVTFLSYDPDWENVIPGQPASLLQTGRLTTSVVQVAQAFVGVTNLPPMGAYEDAINAALS
ncbi:hypothetical protein JOF28_001661 [Leucobacter exalbidus]|uniref:Restriction endonuclease type II NotI domain-containing protein n=1 Tax=Leucobacter exalbidus TaxID=662960 RepID=A0A940T438_9MICO|nr:hypothetical protein [Leucobacter exalbidus]